MYILISIEIQAKKTNILVAEKKKTIVDYLKGKGYYYNKSWDRYINDNNNKEMMIDYTIEKIDKL